MPFAHAFELHSLRKPGVGAHSGATEALAALALAQAAGRSGRDLIVAIVAGREASFRIGAATLHNPEPDPTPFGPMASIHSLLATSLGRGPRRC